MATDKSTVTIDGNEAAAHVAYRLAEMAVIYPITPSSTMGELADDWSARGRPNIWGGVPQIVEMQSEAGAIGAVHGALQGGAMCTTFTASQGLLLMIPNMFKIAGELTAFVMHVAARSVATHALSIFGDHSDVMACRATGFAMLASVNAQEAHDQAAIALAASLATRVPFLHFFDGFRTSHELNRVDLVSDEALRLLIDPRRLADHRARALNPDRPRIGGTAQNPDTFFQAREACNGFYDRVPSIVQGQMDRFAALTGRQYRPYEYVGHPEADRVVVVMASAAETVMQTVRALNDRGERVGVVIVRMFRPFATDLFAAALPPTVRKIAVLDRTKEPGAVGEPLYMDVVGALHEKQPAGGLSLVIGGRYGLSSKEFTPAMAKAVFDELAGIAPRRHFTVGIIDDVTHLSLPVDESFDLEDPTAVRALFYGLGSDGTVGANKNSIKIIGDETSHHAQGYFVYDSKKSGAMTTSHLRFGAKPIHAPYLIRKASFVACHQFHFLQKLDVLEAAADGAVFLVNAPYPREAVWDALPREIQDQIIGKKLRLFAIDANAVARATGMGSRINTVMQACFFAISGVLPADKAIEAIKASIRKSYARRGEEVVRRNFAAVDQTLAALHEVPVPPAATSTFRQSGFERPEMPDFVRRVTSVMMAGKGDRLPVSAFPVDGAWPVGTTQFEKRDLAIDAPQWDPATCIQCNACAFACPHAAIRAKVFGPEALASAPPDFVSVPSITPEFKGLQYTLQLAPEDCTGCNLCVEVCPERNKTNPSRKAINMRPLAEFRERERDKYAFFLDIPEIDRARVRRLNAKTVQLLQPLFEYSGACGGCGETPYIKALTQLFGDRLLIANATGCSSIYGGNLPTTPYAADRNGRGPAWANSLFEDNAEFGLGITLAVRRLAEHARRLLKGLCAPVGQNRVDALLSADQGDEAGIADQRLRVAELRRLLAGLTEPQAVELAQIADYLVKKSVWLIGGDGWAYDIGYGGLDHVLSLPYDLNVLVLDTEVYSNTGGQASKATPIGAAAKFAASGKGTQKKDLGLMAMSYRNAYVASVAFGSSQNHVVKALLEAESYPGPSLVIAYSHCIAHGYDLRFGPAQQALAVDSGIWPLYRYDPRRTPAGMPPLQIDSPPVHKPAWEYLRNETRFAMVQKIDPARFTELSRASGRNTAQRLALYRELSRISLPTEGPGRAAPAPANADAEVAAAEVER